MTYVKGENYKDYPKEYICTGKTGKDFDPVNQEDNIKILGLNNRIYLIGDDGMYYLDLRSSQEYTGYVRWLDMLSEEDREIETADDFYGGGCH